MSTTAHESQSSSLQNPYWEPPYSQPAIMVEDLLVINIFAPGTVSMQDQLKARVGLLDTQEINRFRLENKMEEPRKKRYPFLYPSKPNSDPIST
ncbi:MAG: hypothetical protein ACTSWW_04245 [Promethearchaeota archaeon]